ncbi:MAG: tellurite resistance protein TerB [Pseudorhodobacter sp.]|jgi:tellurite resistance protein TerB
MMNWLKTNTAAARLKMSEEMTKYRNRDFMEAVVAGCALVAAADGSVSGAEKQKMVGYMQASDELKVFKIDDVIAAFTAAVAKFDFDATIGKGEALRKIAKIKGKNGADRLLVRVCCAIGAADGNFDAQERAAVVTICTELGLDPADFDL